MANFEALRWVISLSINILFLKSECAAARTVGGLNSYNNVTFLKGFTQQLQDTFFLYYIGARVNNSDVRY